MEREDNLSFGVFKPVGHVVISFPSEKQAEQAAGDLEKAGFSGNAARRFSDRQMLSQIAHDLDRASPVAAVGQELNLIKAHRALAERGYHWLIVQADGDDARRVADTAAAAGAESAQHYGRFIIEELITRPTDLAQVGESPDRGLDPQTPSGTTAERAELRPPPDDERG